MELSNNTYLFAALNNAAGTEIVVSNATTSVNLPQLLSVQDGSLELSGGATMTVPMLSNINGANLIVTGGVTLAILEAKSYTHTAGSFRDDVIIRATDVGSKIDLGNVANLTNGTTNDRITIEAISERGDSLDLLVVYGTSRLSHTIFWQHI